MYSVLPDEVEEGVLVLLLLLLHLHEVCGAGPAYSALRPNFRGPGSSAECSMTSLGASMKAAMVALAMGFESASLRAIHWDWTLCKLSLPMTTPSRLLSDIMGFKDPSPTMKARDSNRRELDLAECREIQGLRLGMSLLAVSVPVNATMLEVHLLVFP